MALLRPPLSVVNGVSGLGHTTTRPKKRSRADDPVGVIRAKRTRVRRCVFSELPLDVLLEIFGHMDPLDLLHLARTSKDLRRTLLSRSQASIWMNARKRIVGLPELPRDISEPAYANLAFSKHCHHCLKPHVKEDVFWETRTRTCTKCVDKYYCRSDPDDAKFIPFVATVSNRDRANIQVTLKTLHDKLIQDILRIKDLPAQERSTEENVEPFVRMAIETIHISEHSKLCRAWHNDFANNKYQDNRRMKAERLNDVVQRLRGLGWTEELDQQKSLDFLSKHAIVNQPRQLTDRVWNNRKDELVKLVEDAKEARLAEEYRDRFIKRKDVMVAMISEHLDRLPLPFDSITPRPNDIVCYGQFKDVLLDDTIDPSTITRDMFQQTFSILPQFFDEWVASRKLELVELLRSWRKDPNASLADLELATTMFHCRNKCAISYPRVLVHRCLYLGRYNGPDELCPVGKCPLRVWGLDEVSVLEKGLASDLVRACGKDPATTTTAEMEATNPFVKYTLRYFRNPHKDKMFARWSGACQEWGRHWFGSPTFCAPEALSTHEVVLAGEEENRFLSDLHRLYNGIARTRCRHCNATRPSSEHMRTHDISSPKLDDWVFHIDDPYARTFSWPPGGSN